MGWLQSEAALPSLFTAAMALNAIVLWQMFKRPVLTVCLFILSMGFTVAAFVVGVTTSVERISQLIIAVPALAIVAGVTLAFVLYTVRRFAPLTYGLTEIAFSAILFAYSAMPPMTATSVIAYVGAIYVMVRGLTNAAEPIEKRWNAVSAILEETLVKLRQDETGSKGGDGKGDADGP